MLCGSEKRPNKAENIRLLLKKHGILESAFNYVGDSLQDIRACKEANVICLSVAWKRVPYCDLLEKENPGLVFYSL